jgi:hypothetical protein
MTETEIQKPKRSILANLIGFVWAVHILIAALLYPRFLLPTSDSPQEAKKLAWYAASRKIFGILILFINLLCILAMVTRPTWVDVAKVFFIFLTWVLLAVIYILFNHLRDIHDLLSAPYTRWASVFTIW